LLSTSAIKVIHLFPEANVISSIWFPATKLPSAAVAESTLSLPSLFETVKVLKLYGKVYVRLLLPIKWPASSQVNSCVEIVLSAKILLSVVSVVSVNLFT
jgi:hypothetical protein